MSRPSKKAVLTNSEETINNTNMEQSKETNVDDFSGFDFNPMDQEIIERSYNKEQNNGVYEDIPEPSFIHEQPTYDFDEPLEGQQQQTVFDNISNPHLNDLDDKEKKAGAEHLVTGVFEAYKVLLGAGAHFSKIKEEKVQERIMKGDIDNELRVPISEDGTEVNVLEYAQANNQQVEELFKFDPAFEKKVKPAMIREFSKRGYGLTDIQYIGVMWAKEIGTKAVLMMSLRKQGNFMLNQFAEMSKQYRSFNMQQAQEPPVERVTPDSIVTPPKAEPKQEEPTKSFDSVEDIEEAMMEE